MTTTKQRSARRAAAAIFAVLCAAAAPAAWSRAAAAQEVTFKDPSGDDKGPGTYVYPTDPIYKPGSFDLTDFRLKVHGDKVDLEAKVEAKLEDPWHTGSGFSLQMILIFIQTVTKPAHGMTQGIPGMAVQFSAEDAWERCIILSPQPAQRVRAELAAKAAALKGAVIVPDRVRGNDHTISATIDRKLLPAGDVQKWGYQIVMAANDDYPSDTSVLMRKVNETESQHRFGGGDDGDCDPNVLDLFATYGEGVPAEAEAQRQMLRYDCKAVDPPPGAAPAAASATATVAGGVAAPATDASTTATAPAATTAAVVPSTTTATATTTAASPGTTATTGTEGKPAAAPTAPTVPAAPAPVLSKRLATLRMVHFKKPETDKEKRLREKQEKKDQEEKERKERELKEGITDAATATPDATTTTPTTSTAPPGTAPTTPPPATATPPATPPSPPPAATPAPTPPPG